MLSRFIHELMFSLSYSLDLRCVYVRGLQYAADHVGLPRYPFFTSSLEKLTVGCKVRLVGFQCKSSASSCSPIVKFVLRFGMSFAVSLMHTLIQDLWAIIGSPCKVPVLHRVLRNPWDYVMINGMSQTETFWNCVHQLRWS